MLNIRDFSEKSAACIFRFKVTISSFFLLLTGNSQNEILPEDQFFMSECILQLSQQGKWLWTVRTEVVSWHEKSSFVFRITSKTSLLFVWSVIVTGRSFHPGLTEYWPELELLTPVNF